MLVVVQNIKILSTWEIVTKLKKKLPVHVYYLCSAHWTSSSRVVLSRKVRKNGGSSMLNIIFCLNAVGSVLRPITEEEQITM